MKTFYFVVNLSKLTVLDILDGFLKYFGGARVNFSVYFVTPEVTSEDTYFPRHLIIKLDGENNN